MLIRIPRPPIEQMTPDELECWLQATCEALRGKMARERAYLARRARRGVRTPTDAAYEADLLLEADMLTFFGEMLAQVPAYRQEYIERVQVVY